MVPPLVGCLEPKRTEIKVKIIDYMAKKLVEALESGMFGVIKIVITRRYATRKGKENQPLNIKTAV